MLKIENLKIENLTYTLFNDGIASFLHFAVDCDTENIIPSDYKFYNTYRY
jgi:hypothetical protein